MSYWYEASKQATHLDPLALDFVELEEILEVHTEMAVDAEAAEPAATTLSFSIGMAGAIRRGANKKASELARGVFHLAGNPIARPSLPALQLLRGLSRRGGVVMRAPVTRRAKLQIKFLP